MRRRIFGEKLGQHALTLNSHTPKVGLHSYAHVCGKLRRTWAWRGNVHAGYRRLFGSPEGRRTI